MFLFLITLFPLVFLLYTNGIRSASLQDLQQSARTLFLVGFAFSLVYCLCDWFFVSPVRYGEYAFLREAWHGFWVELLLPFALCCVPYFAFFAEKSTYKLRSVTFMLFGFYALFVPYRVFTRYSVQTPFVLMVKPFLFVCLFCALYFLLNAAATCAERGKKGRVGACVCAALLVLPVPALTETAWFLGSPLLIVAAYVLAFAFVCLCVVPILCGIASGKNDAVSAND